MPGHSREQRQEHGPASPAGRSPSPTLQPRSCSRPGAAAALTSLGSRTLADGEDLPEVLLLLRKALLEALQLPQALAALVLHGAHVLDQVQLGLGGVVTEHTVVVAAFPFHPALVVLQVLWRAEQRDVSDLHHSSLPG